MDEREKLIVLLDEQQAMYEATPEGIVDCNGFIADFILANRRKVLEEIERTLEKAELYGHGYIEACRKALSIIERMKKGF